MAFAAFSTRDSGIFRRGLPNDGKCCIIDQDTEKHFRPDGTKWDTERPITEKEYGRYMLEADPALGSVSKVKYRFVYDSCRFEIDVYPFSTERAVLFCYSEKPERSAPPELDIISDVTGKAEYKNKQLAKLQSL